MTTTTTLRTASPNRPLTPAPLTSWTRAATHPVVCLLQRVVMLLLWRPLVALVGPLRVEGVQHLPAGPCVIVADHSSHVDTIAIRVALARAGRRRVAAAAAEDYWFATRRRGMVALLGAGAFPLPRSGDAGLRRTAALLADGFDVIVFPQGSRAPSARTWRCGIGRLAVEAGATILPAVLSGADRVLPRGRRALTPHPLGVGFGAPLVAEPQEGVEVVTNRARAAALAIVPPAVAEGRLVSLSARLRANTARRGALILAVWAFAEATVWPLIPDLLLAGSVFAVPRLAPQLVAVTTVASALGGAFALTIGRAGVQWPLLAITPRMPGEAAASLATDGAAGVLAQPLSGIPYKVFNAVAVHTDVEVLSWVGWTILGRGARMAFVALVAGAAGRLLWSRRVHAGWAPRIHALVVLTGLVLFVVGWTAVLLVWR